MSTAVNLLRQYMETNKHGPHRSPEYFKHNFAILPLSPLGEGCGPSFEQI